MTLACHSLMLEVAGRRLCRDLTFTVQPGEVWGVLGPNGSGKTTLLNVLSGLTDPAQGRVTIGDKSLRSMKAIERARFIGLLPQHEDITFWGTAREYAELGGFPHRGGAWFSGRGGLDETTVTLALRQMDVAACAGRRYATLSGGERQRVRLAQLLVQAPHFMLLDEPLQHLDLNHQREVLRRVASLACEDDQKRAVVLVLHDVLWPARYCTHALLLDGRGGVRTGLAADVLTQQHLEALFGCALSPAGSFKAGFIPAL